MADDGQAPPLYCKASPALLWGSMYGTEHLDPSGLRKWKATAVSHAQYCMMACRNCYCQCRKWRVLHPIELTSCSPGKPAVSKLFLLAPLAEVTALVTVQHNSCVHSHSTALELQGL